MTDSWTDQQRRRGHVSVAPGCIFFWYRGLFVKEQSWMISAGSDRVSAAFLAAAVLVLVRWNAGPHSPPDTAALPLLGEATADFPTRFFQPMPLWPWTSRPSWRTAKPGTGGSNPSSQGNPASPTKSASADLRTTPSKFVAKMRFYSKCGQWRLDVTESYTVDEKAVSLQPAVTLPSTISAATVSCAAAVGYRYRPPLRNDPPGPLYADLPAGWTNTQSSFFGSDSYSNSVGLGDASFALSYLWHKSSGCCGDPDVVITAAVTAPTSNANFPASCPSRPTPPSVKACGLAPGISSSWVIGSGSSSSTGSVAGTRSPATSTAEEVSAGAQYSLSLRRRPFPQRSGNAQQHTDGQLYHRRPDQRRRPAGNPTSSRFDLRPRRHPLVCTGWICEPFVLLGLTNGDVEHSVRHRLDVLTVRPEQRLICGPLSPVEKNAIGLRATSQYRRIYESARYLSCI